MAHPNEILLRRGYEAFAKGDLDTLRSIFAPDIVWHVGGRGPLAGSYKGIDEVFGFFAELVKRSDGTFKVEVHDLIASDDHAVALNTNRAQREGKTLNAPVVGIFHASQGKVTEAWFMAEDQYAVDEFWA